MKHWYAALTLAVMVLMPGALFSQEEDFLLCYVDRYPYHYKDGTSVKGLIADPVNYAFKKAGLRYRWQETPAKRMIYLLAQNTGNIVMVGWFKNQEREKAGNFSIPVYTDKPSNIIVRRDNLRIMDVKSLKALFLDRTFSILVKDGYSYGAANDSLISRYKPLTYKVTVDMIGMARMIHTGRADYMFSTAEEGEYLINSSGAPAADLVLRSFPDSPDGETRYLLFSKKIKTEQIQVINKFIREYKEKTGAVESR